MQQVLVTGPGSFEIQDIAAPSAGPDDVIVDVALCGICGSDLAYVAMGGLPGPKGEAMPLGHELSGVISAVGSNVRDFSVGQRVVVNPLAADNNIGNGGPEGGFTRHLLVRNATRGRCIYALPDSLSDTQGALVEPLGVAMHAVNQGDVKADDKVVVFGAGPIGLGAIACLRHRGVSDIVAIDFSAHRLEAARELGASATFNAADGDCWAFIREQQGSEDLYGMAMAASDVLIDAAGAGSVIRGIFDNAKFGARIVGVAMHKEEVSLPFFQVMAKELVIKGAMAYPDEFDEVIDMLQAGRVDVSPMVSHEYSLDAFADAFATAQQADRAAKVMVRCNP